MAAVDISALLPPSLLLPPRLSAHKYLMVCTLTVAAWDTLVLSPRTWRLTKTKEWPLLKINFLILRYLMPIEFTIVAVAFFDSTWSAARCQQFYLFEPIVTAFLMTVASASLAIRLYAIFDKSKLIMGVLGSLLFVQVVVQAICCAFYDVVPLKVGQGCIAGPRHNWVGIYWLAPAIFYSVTLGLAIARSAKSQAVKSINLWKLFLRDGLNLYGAIWIMNMVNMFFWFIVTPTGPADAIKTILTSMTAVLTATMTLRIILGVRGSLVQGGTYSGISSSNRSASNPSHQGVGGRVNTNGGVVIGGASMGGRDIGGPRSPGIINTGHNNPNAQTYTIDEMRAKAAKDWHNDAGSEDADDKNSGLYPPEKTASLATDKDSQVKIRVDREVDYEQK